MNDGGVPARIYSFLLTTATRTGIRDIRVMLRQRGIRGTLSKRGVEGPWKPGENLGTTIKRTARMQGIRQFRVHRYLGRRLETNATGERVCYFYFELTAEKSD